MKKQLFTMLCAAMLLTSCGQTADSGSDKSSADKTDVQTSLTDSVVSQTETDADTVTYMVRHFPYYKQNDEHSTVIEDAGECAVITESLDKIETMLTDEYKVEVSPNDAHSDLESYAINGSGSESGKWVFVTVDNIDGYNFSADETNYNIPDEYLKPILDILTQKLPAADTQAEQDDPDTSGYRVRLSQDPNDPDNSWYITDPAVMGYLDDFTQNYLPDCEEITEIGTVPGGANFADVFFKNGSNMFIRPVCGNIYNIRFDEKYYEIPQNKLNELMDTIRATQPPTASSGNAKTDDNDSVSIDLTLSPYNDYDLEQNAEEPIYLSDDLYIYNSLYFSANNEKNDKEDKLDIDLLLNNTTEYDVTGDFFFELEYYSSDDKWYSVPLTDYFFNEMAVIYPKGAYNVNYKLSDINYDFKEGKYRLIRKIKIDKYTGDCLVAYYFNL